MQPKRPIYTQELTLSLELQPTRNATMHDFCDLPIRVEFCVHLALRATRTDDAEPAEIEAMRVIALADAACSSELCDGRVSLGENITSRLSARDFSRIESAIWDLAADRTIH